MDLKPPFINTDRAEDVPISYKYHPLILENTFQTQLLTIADNIKSQEKHNVLQKLYDSFRNILSCFKCNNVLGENAIRFSCDHMFCNTCVKEFDSCLKCNSGYTQGSKITDFSNVLDCINEIKHNFNHESVLLELIKFLFTPESMIVKQQLKFSDTANAGTPLAAKTDHGAKNSRGKFTATGKRFKTLSSKTDSTKRKLLFIQNVVDSPRRTESLENDSENLFIDSTKVNKQCKNENKVNSYLEIQGSIDESPKFDAKNFKIYSKSVKRKLQCTEFEVNSTEKLVHQDLEESSNKKRKVNAYVENHRTDETLSDTEKISNRKRKSSRLKILPNLNDLKNASLIVESDKSELNTSNVSVLAKCTPKCVVSKNSSKSSEKKSEGTFLGFHQTHLTDSYNKLYLLAKYYNRLFKNDKVKLRISSEEDDNNVYSVVLDRESGNSKSTLDISNLERADDGFKVIDYDKKNKRFHVKKSSNANETDKNLKNCVECLENRESFLKNATTEESENSTDLKKSLPSKKKRGRNKNKIKNTSYSKYSNTQKKRKDVERSHFLTEPEDGSAKEILNVSNVISSSSTKTGKIDVAKHDINFKKEKENFNLNYSDDDTDDVVDINLWNREDRMTKKRKSLFKAVKERNKKNKLLKLLEEKTLLQKKGKNINNSCDVSNNVALDATSIVTDLADPIIRESVDSNIVSENINSKNNGLLQRNYNDQTLFGKTENAPKGKNYFTESIKIKSKNLSQNSKIVNVFPLGSETSSATSSSNCTYTPTLPEENIKLPTTVNFHCSSRECIDEPFLHSSSPTHGHNFSVICSPQYANLKQSGEISSQNNKMNMTLEEQNIENKTSSLCTSNNECYSDLLTTSVMHADASLNAKHKKCSTSDLKLSNKNNEPPCTSISGCSNFVNNSENLFVDSSQSVGLCSPGTNSKLTFISADMANISMLNTSTPISDKCLRTIDENTKCESESKLSYYESEIGDNEEKKIHSNNLNEVYSEELPSNSNSSSVVIKTQRNSIQLLKKSDEENSDLRKFETMNEEAAVNSENITKINIKLKSAHLKKTINDQNQKSLVNLQKNFRMMSPTTLMIAKSKLDKSHSDCIENNTVKQISKFSSKNDPEKLDICIEKCDSNLRESESRLTNVQNLLLQSLDDIHTLPSSPARMSVACQTTSELHIALLIREFPHFFKQSNLPSSIYDTPVEPAFLEGKVNDTVPVKTPDVEEFSLNQHEKFTRVSSITSTEKDLYDKDFAEQSVLCDSFCTPGSDGTLGEHVDISCISLLSSSSKKPIKSESQDSEKRKLSVRLNFQNVEPSLLNRNKLVSSDGWEKVEQKTATSILDSTHLSGQKTSQSSCNMYEVASEKQNMLSNDSNEIAFTDAGTEGYENDVIAKKPANDEDEKKGFSGSLLAETDRILIPDTHGIFEEEVEIFHDNEAIQKAIRVNENVEHCKTTEIIGEVIDQKSQITVSEAVNCKSPEVNLDPDDDVDFVAGTPTCYNKRCMNSSIDNIQSQSMVTIAGNSEQISLVDKQIFIFDSHDCRMLKSETSDLNIDEEMFKSENVHSYSANVIAEASALSKISTKSVDLFNSDSMISIGSTIHLTTSGLKDADNRIVKLFCDKFSAVLLDKLTDKSTHLIVKTDERNQTSRTFKYLQAIVNCFRIVSVSWLCECLRQGSVVDEESFIPRDSSGECGPLRAFNVARNLTPSPLSWLRDYCVFFVEPVPQGCTLSQLQETIAKTGAIVVNSLKEMKKYPSHHHVIIVSEDDENVETSNEEIADWLQVYQAVTIEFNWLLEVIGRNRLVPFAEYEIVEIPNEFLMRLNFPSDMLEVELEED